MINVIVYERVSTESETACDCIVLSSVESGLFGVSLSTLLEQDQRRMPGTKVPLILQHVREQRLKTVTNQNMARGINSEATTNLPDIL